MKVTYTGPSTGPGRRRRIGAAGGSGSAGFAKHVETSGARPPGLAAPGLLAALGGVLAVQAVPPGGAERARLLRRSYSLLDQLEELRIALLEGRLAAAAVRRLADLLDAERPAIDDPQLRAVLDQVELRAAVELAKRQRG
jgi:hypothetical protein